MDKNHLRKKITGLFTGLDFEIRKVRILDYMRDLGGLPGDVSPSIAEQLRKFADSVRAKGEDRDYQARTVEFLLKRGVVKPKLWFGAEEDCPEGQIQFEDLGSDADFVAQRVAEFSFEMPGLGKMEKFFRGTGAGAPGPGSEEVRAETVAVTGQDGVDFDGESGI